MPSTSSLAPRLSRLPLRPSPSLSSNLNHLAALAAAVAFGLGGYLTSYPLLQLALLETIAWLPLVLLLLRRGVRLGSVRCLLGAGAVLGLSALAGHPQTFLHVSALAAAYYLFLMWQARWRWLWGLGLGLLVGSTAVGAAMAAFLPALRFLAFTVRSDVTYEFVAKGFPLLDYLQTLVPGPLSLWQPQYVGVTAVFLAAFALWGRKNWPARLQRNETLFWLLIVLLAAWLSLGDKGILFELAYRILPGFALFRQQERLVALVSLGLALLAAQGLALWGLLETAKRRLVWRSSALTLAGLLLLAGVLLAMINSMVGWEWLPVWLRQWFFGGLTLLLLWPKHAVNGTSQKTRQEQWAIRPLLVVILLFVDLFLSVRAPMNLQPGSPAVFWPQPVWLEALQTDAPARLDSQNLFHSNLGELYGLEDVRGISPLKPQALARFEDLPPPLRWRLLNVTHVLAPQPIESDLVEIARIDESVLPGEQADAFVYRFESALPRAWMVYTPLIAPDADLAWQRLQAPDFDPANVVVFDAADAVDFSDVAVPSQPPQVRVKRETPGALSISIITETPGILVFSEWALPGWRATLDGTAVPLMTANTALQALKMPAGVHSVTLRYAPIEIPLGIAISLLALLSAGLLAWRWQPVIPVRTEKMATPQRKTTKDPKTVSVIQDFGWRRALWLMTAFILVGFGLRVFQLGYQELRGDEAFSYLYTLLPFDQVIPELIDEGDPHSPLHYLMLNAWTAVAGESEFSMRYLSLIPGVLLLSLMFQLGRKMSGRRVGLLAALFSALSPSLIWLSQDVRNQYNLALLFTALATWLLVCISQSTRRGSDYKSRKDFCNLPSWLGWSLYAVSAALAVYGHYYALFALLAHGFYLWFARVEWRKWAAWLASGIVALFLFLPWLTAVFNSLLSAGQLGDPGRPELARYLTTVGVEMLLGANLTSWQPRWLFLGGVILMLAGARVLWRQKPAWAAMLLGWLGMAALFIYLIRFSRSTFNPFYISVAAPAWWLLLAAALVWLWFKGRWQRVIAGLSVALWLGAVLLSLRNYYFDPTFSRTLGYRQAADIVAANVRAGDIFLAHFPDPALDYYLRHVDLPRQMLPAGPDAELNATEAALNRLAQDYSRIWFVPYDHSVWDSENSVPRWLAINMLQEASTPADRLTVERFRPLPAAEDVMQPLEQKLGEAVHLRAAYVTVNGRPVDLSFPVTLAGGDDVAVTLLWEAEQPIAESYTVFVHLLGSDGVLLAQHDGAPRNGALPTPLWSPGDRILDQHLLVVPDGVAGNGRFVVGLYNSDTLERLPLSNGGDAVELAPAAFE